MKILDVMKVRRGQTLKARVVTLLAGLPEDEVLTVEEVSEILHLDAQYLRSNMPALVPNGCRQRIGQRIFYGKPKALKRLHESITRG
jgi:hypothetical protein